MPYIVEEKREVLNPAIDELITALRGLQSDDPMDNTEENLNYIISRLLDTMYNANDREMNNALGVLTGVLFEYYRRMVSPYKDQKIYENDDVYTNTRASK